MKPNSPTALAIAAFAGAFLIAPTTAHAFWWWHIAGPLDEQIAGLSSGGGYALAYKPPPGDPRDLQKLNNEHFYGEGSCPQRVKCSEQNLTEPQFKSLLKAHPNAVNFDRLSKYTREFVSRDPSKDQKPGSIIKLPTGNPGPTNPIPR